MRLAIKHVPLLLRIAVVSSFALTIAACGGTGSDAGADLASAPDAAIAADLLPTTNPTYANFAQGFFTTYCISCHPSSSSTRDFTKYATIKSNSHNMACGVSPIARAGCSGNPAPSQFPIGNGPHPTDAERNELVQWIDNGLPQ